MIQICITISTKLSILSVSVPSGSETNYIKLKNIINKICDICISDEKYLLSITPLPPGSHQKMIE